MTKKIWHYSAVGLVVLALGLGLAGSAFDAPAEAAWLDLTYGVLAIAAALAAALVWRRFRRGRRPAAELAKAKEKPVEPGKELRRAVSVCGWALVGIIVFSALGNILMMTGALYMLEVYDRVLPSRSIATLVALSAVALLLFSIQGAFDFIRARILVRVGSHLDESVGPRVYDAITRMPQRVGQRGDGLQSMRDLDAIRGFLGGGGPNAFLDLPWLPFYMALIFMFHWILGLTAVVGTVLLVCMTILTELMTGNTMRRVTSAGGQRSAIADASRRNAEVLNAMGMGSRLATRYSKLSGSFIDNQTQVSDVAGGLGAISKTLRMVLQSAMLGVGAWLVIHNEASGGIMIAGSILVGRALAPVDLAISQWKTFVAARQGWKRLNELLAKLPPDGERITLPEPKQALKVEGLGVVEPGGKRVLIRDVTFELQAGSGMAVIGPSGSGKSTLSRALVGAWLPAAGRVRIDGASLDQWPRDQIGRQIGYLPQDVELFAGSIAENISRLEVETDSEAVIAAAQAAGVHEMVLNFPDGYQTQIGENGAVLSAGQRQRIALARALYRDPFLVVLDEPNSNLDSDGDKALMAAIHSVRKRGGIAVVVSHRPGALEALDYVLVMADGKPVSFGTRDQVLAKHFPNLVQPAAMARARESGPAQIAPAPVPTVQPVPAPVASPPTQRKTQRSVA